MGSRTAKVSTISTIRADLRANRGNVRASVSLVLFRVVHRLRCSRSPLQRLLGRVVGWVNTFVADWFFGIQLHWATEVGPGLRIPHGVGLVVHQKSRIGSNCVLRQGVTLAGWKGRAPVLGDRVNVGANSTLVGGVTIGEGTRVGAGAVVTDDAPPNVVIAGNPARVLRAN